MSSNNVTYRDHIFHGVKWSVEGSKGETYTVEMDRNDLTCTCHRWKYWTDCKHVKQIEERILGR